MAQKSRFLQDTCRDNLIAAFPLINEAGKSSAGCEERPYFPGKTIILPRQARDKRNKTTKDVVVFLVLQAGGALLGVPDLQAAAEPERCQRPALHRAEALALPQRGQLCDARN